MGKIIYGLMLCLSLWLGMGTAAQAAVLEGPWRYYEADENFIPGENIPGTVRHNVEEWPVFDREKRPRFSSRRLWLAVKVQDTDPQKNILLFMTAKQSMRMWLGDKLIFSAGTFQPQRFDEGCRPYMRPLPEFTGEQLLVVELYANSPRDLGWFSLFSVDTEQAQIGKLFYSDIPLVLAFPVGIAVIFIMFLYYYFNPQGWKKLYAYISLFMMVFVLWLISASNVKSLFIGGAVFWWYSLSILAYLLPITANLILTELLQDKPYARMKYVLRANIGLFVLAMGGELMGLHTMNGFMGFYYLLLALGESVAVYWCLRAAHEGDALCRAVLLPAVVFTLLGVLDGVSGHFHLLPWHTYVSPLGAYAFLYFVLAILRERMRHEEHLLKQTAGLEQEAAMMQMKSETDALTGCWNRNKLKKLLAKAMGKARKTGQPFGLLMLDLDYFKKINDSYGHEAGDAVLRAFATVVRQQLEADKQCVRWGGEEFLVLADTGELEPLQELAERIRRQVEITPLAGYKITCSIGITLWQSGTDTTATLFKRVDSALYQAKDSGRNCVIVQL